MSYAFLILGALGWTQVVWQLPVHLPPQRKFKDLQIHGDAKLPNSPFFNNSLTAMVNTDPFRCETSCFMKFWPRVSKRVINYKDCFSVHWPLTPLIELISNPNLCCVEPFCSLRQWNPDGLCTVCCGPNTNKLYVKQYKLRMPGCGDAVQYLSVRFCFMESIGEHNKPLYNDKWTSVLCPKVQRHGRRHHAGVYRGWNRSTWLHVL